MRVWSTVCDCFLGVCHFLAKEPSAREGKTQPRSGFHTSAKKKVTCVVEFDYDPEIRQDSLNSYAVGGKASWPGSPLHDTPRDARGFASF